MRKLFVLACALALALCAERGYAAPSVYPFDDGSMKPMWTDTLGTLASDSVAVSDSLNVEGARFVVLYVQSTGSDSIAVPVLQTKIPGGQWSGTGGAAQLGNSVSTTGIFKNVTTTTAINQVGIIAYEIHSEIDGSGTPRPWPVGYIRFRLKATNARRIAAGAQVSSGTFTFKAKVYR